MGIGGWHLAAYVIVPGGIVMALIYPGIPFAKGIVNGAIDAFHWFYE